MNKEQIEIEVTPNERVLLDALAKQSGKGISEFILDCVHQQISLLKETSDLNAMVSQPSKALVDLWDNDKDGAYD